MLQNHPVLRSAVIGAGVAVVAPPLLSLLFGFVFSFAFEIGAIVGLHMVYNSLTHQSVVDTKVQAATAAAGPIAVRGLENVTGAGMLPREMIVTFANGTGHRVHNVRFRCTWVTRTVDDYERPKTEEHAITSTWAIGAFEARQSYTAQVRFDATVPEKLDRCTGTYDAVDRSAAIRGGL